MKNAFPSPPFFVEDHVRSSWLNETCSYTAFSIMSSSSSSQLFLRQAVAGDSPFSDTQLASSSIVFSSVCSYKVSLILIESRSNNNEGGSVVVSQFGKMKLKLPPATPFIGYFFSRVFVSLPSLYCSSSILRHDQFASKVPMYEYNGIYIGKTSLI